MVSNQPSLTPPAKGGELVPQRFPDYQTVPESVPNLPTFLVIGVAKAGTTALYQHLKAHPGIFMAPVKEPNFFSFDAKKQDAIVTHLDDYRALFEGIRDETAAGEASPRYFHSPEAPARIAARIPEVRLVALLRHPVERAYSHYLDMMNSGAFAPRPFAEVFREKASSVETWSREPFACYGFQLSFYHASLKRYFDVFPRERIRVYLFEDYVAEPRAVLGDLYRFLGVDDGFVPDLETRHNPTHGVPRSALLHKTVMRSNLLKTVAQKLLPQAVRRKVAGLLLRGLRTKKPALSPALRDAFTAVYREDILKTQALIGRDLSLWLP